MQSRGAFVFYMLYFISSFPSIISSFGFITRRDEFLFALCCIILITPMKLIHHNWLKFDGMKIYFLFIPLTDRYLLTINDSE